METLPNPAAGSSSPRSSLTATSSASTSPLFATSASSNSGMFSPVGSSSASTTTSNISSVSRSSTILAPSTSVTPLAQPASTSQTASQSTSVALSLSNPSASAPATPVSSASAPASNLTLATTNKLKFPSEIVGKTVEEIIKGWTSELQQRAPKFKKQAEVLGNWDRRIISNRNVLIKLESEVAKVVESQLELERPLELIETHLQEVEKALENIEEQAERLYMDERGALEDETTAARDSMFQQAEFIERELSCMGEKIRETVETSNANQGSDIQLIENANPLDVIIRVLNNQLSSLVWINEKAAELSIRIQKPGDHGMNSHTKGISLIRLRGA